jgi:hypothetical protein
MMVERRVPLALGVFSGEHWISDDLMPSSASLLHSISPAVLPTEDGIPPKLVQRSLEYAARVN